MTSRAGVSVVAGLLFGAGLGVSGVANPVVINNFLDLASPDLDVSLFITFCVALAVSTLIYQLAFRLRTRPILHESFSLPTRTDIDARLVGGAAIFGIGWALSGYCVGPALAGLTAMAETAAVYLAAVALGTVVCERAFREP